MLKAAERVEILTLQDNFIEITAIDNSDLVSRARYLAGGEIAVSILAEHGFSALVDITREGRTRSLLFDFGFSKIGADNRSPQGPEAGLHHPDPLHGTKHHSRHREEHA